MPRRIASACVLAGAIVLGLLFAGPGGPSAGAQSAAAPNFVLLLTDDQPANNMGPLQRTRELVAAQGATFRRAYVTDPLCCPSRASILGGQYMHNHLVRGNTGSYGGWHRFRDLGGEAKALPVRLGDEGYYSVHIGKYMNGYTDAEGLHVPPGWDEWYARLNGERRAYFDYTLVEKGPTGDPSPVSYGADETDYSTDVFAGKALDFIERAPAIGQPFFLSISFAAPHHPFTPAPRDRLALAGGGLPVQLGFNERNFDDKPGWLRREAPHRFGPGWRRKIASEQRSRDETLLAVDHAVDQIVNSLAQEGLLENTYLILSSDNGLFRGEHRLTGGKYLPHEPASHVPLVIKGPGIPPGVASGELVANIDIAQTILQLAGIGDPSLDGRSLVPFAQNPSRRTSRALVIESDTGPGRGIGLGNDPDLDLGGASRAGIAGLRGVSNLDQERLAGVSAATGDRAPAYRAIRTDRYLFVIYASGDRELYDMSRDPGQLRSLSRDARYAPVRAWLFRRLLKLRDCGGAECRAQIGKPPPPLRRR